MSNMVDLCFQNINLVTIFIEIETTASLLKKVVGGGPEKRLS